VKTRAIKIFAVPACYLALPALIASLPSSEAAARSAKLTCNTLAEGFLKASMTPASTVATAGGGCTFTNLRIKTGTRQSYSVERLEVAGLADWDPDRTPLPAAVNLDAHGIRFAPDIDSARIRYQIAVSQHPFDVRARIAWNAPTHVLHLQELSMSGPTLKHISLALDVILPSEKIPGSGDFDKLRISHAHVTLDNGYVFESMIVPIILPMIPEDEDPAIEVPKALKAAEKKLLATPATRTDAASRDALIRFVRDLPHPTGHFDLDLNWLQPRSLSDIKGALRGDFLGGARAVAQYVPLAPAAVTSQSDKDAATPR
jgi:hypothetical protein